MNKKTNFLTICGFLILGIQQLQATALDTLETTVGAKVQAISSRMERELALSESQTLQIKTLLEERFSELKSARAGNAVERESVNDKTRKKLSKILTKDQYETYLRLREENRKEKEKFLEENPSYQFSDEDKEMDF